MCYMAACKSPKFFEEQYLIWNPGCLAGKNEEGKEFSVLSSRNEDILLSSRFLTSDIKLLYNLMQDFLGGIKNVGGFK